jgi:hypothetical protein
MIKKLLSCLLLLLLQQGIFAQLNTTDDLILKIPQGNTSSTTTISDYINKNYATDSARIRAIYLWVTNNINYDVAKLLARNSAPPTSRQTVEEVFNTRSAVCQGYADLFIDLCTRAGIPNAFIGGYTKRNGLVSPLAHAWVGAQLKGEWIMGAASLVLSFVGIYQIYYGYSEAYKKHVSLNSVNPDMRNLLLKSGKIGYVARGMVWLILAWLFAKAAWYSNASEAGDTAKAFHFLERASYGSYLLGTLGLGLFCYGLFNFIRAGYERFEN